jgi:DNA-binding HxlR family transcriptional regulator
MAEMRKVNCPIEITLDVLGGKWKAVILFHLTASDGKIGSGTKVRFGELRRRISGITQKMLTQQLRELEAAGIISRTVYAEVPPRVEYAITPYGRTLRPVLEAMCRWGAAHAKRSGSTIAHKAS